MKKNRSITRVLTTCVSACAGILLAAGAHATPSGLYLGGAVGQVEFEDLGDLQTACLVAGLNCRDDDTDTGFKAFLGYQFGEFFALEGGYVDLGTLEAGVDTPVLAVAGFETKGGFLSLLPQIPIGELGAIYGRLGIAAVDAQLTARVPSLGFDESDSGTVGAFAFGFGGALNFGRVTVRVEWERYSFDETFRIAGEDIDAPDLDLISGSLLLRF